MQPLGNSPLPRILAFAFGIVVAVRNFFYDHVPSLSTEAGRPVISVGGVHAGGTGKTPMALLTAKYFVEKGRGAAFLCRGYRRIKKKLIIGKPGVSASWEEVGDEPSLLHSELPVSWLGVYANRVAAARVLCGLAPENSVFILDDGFQHRGIRRTLDIVCLPPDAFGSWLMPAGTLREPLKNCRRADIVCIIGNKKQVHELIQTREKVISRLGCKDVFILYQSPIGWNNLRTGESAPVPPCKKAALVCGIARPERFAELVQDMGISAGKKYFFNDHHAFSADEVEAIGSRPCDGIITTEKDAIRLNTLKLVNCPEIWYLKIELDFFDSQSKEEFFNRLYGSISKYIPTRRCPT
ncbi:MAG TPA: tetraacyldisaccharide 4'-kinase [Chitinivibrionales bacterium]|nr:tetraacyldisaccharide 4'-kinase [Chitinivibrionales bacterium]